MFSCTVNKGSHLRVVHYPGMKNVTRAATFDVSEEVSVEGLEYGRSARRLHAGSRLFAARCSGSCLKCGNSFVVFRTVCTSGELPNGLSAVDFEHAYREAKIFSSDFTGHANTHVLEDVMHHGNYYGCWIETWSKALPATSLNEHVLPNIIQSSIDVADDVVRYRTADRMSYRASAGIN